MMTAVILFAVSDFAPLFIIMVVLVPWLIWGLSFTTERLHDRDKSAWWLGVFYVLPGVLTQIADLLPLTGLTDAVLQKILALAAFALVESRLPARHRRGKFLWPDPLAQLKRRN